MSGDDLKVVLLIVGFLIIAAYVAWDSKKKYKAKVDKKLASEWGKVPNRKYNVDDYENTSHYYKELAEDSGDEGIDDITWNDLGMDNIFKRINTTNSSVGQEYLYKTLRFPEKDDKKLKKMDRLARFFDEHKNERTLVQKIFVKLGFTKFLSASDYIGLIIELKADSNLIHYFALMFIIVSALVCFFVSPPVGIVLLIVSVSFSVVSYYRYKAKVEHYFICISQIVRLSTTAEDIINLKINELSEYTDKLKSLCSTFSSVTRNAGVLQSSNINGSLAEILMDYLRMITHVDLIKFNNMVKNLNDCQSQLYEVMNTLGFIETSISVASFRNTLPYWSEPELREDDNTGIKLEEAYHPMISNPVANSIDANRHVLLTGSNASGKSTFLKTVALNALLSQTIYTSISRHYVAPYFRIYSSMSLKDDLSNNNSYYIVEVKSLKRILDAVGQSGKPVLCFIDEVLRGTNTVERIAASSEILKSINNKKAMVFAATHDIELTAILDKYYDNYHFQEEVTDNDVKFNFKIFKGPATTRNAIKLLNIIGYDKSIVDAAEKQAGYFIDNGIWKM